MHNFFGGNLSIDSIYGIQIGGETGLVAGIADRCVEPVDHYKIFPQRRAPNNSLSGSQFCSVSFTVLISQR